MLSFFIVVAKDSKFGHLDNQGVNGGWQGNGIYRKKVEGHKPDLSGFG
jgi:hypothetical protein